MTSDIEAPNQTALLAHLQPITEAVQAILDNLQAARLYSETPAGREQALAIQRTVRENLTMLRQGVRTMEKADRAIAKVLRKAWRIRA